MNYGYTGDLLCLVGACPSVAFDEGAMLETIMLILKHEP